ncbi:MAG: cell division protein SepF [Coriobacteriia bacterium]|nr:cell division protein SepF [Coriobacteriia bacterium]
MGKIDKLKSRLGFGSGWDTDYLQEDDAEIVQRDDYSGEELARVTYAGLGVNTPAASSENPEGKPADAACDKRYSHDSPFASGASPSAVKKHTRKPDLKRASQISGSELRDVEDSRRFDHQLKMDGSGGSSFRPKDYSEASLIANHLKEGKTVTVDLSLVPMSQRQRFIDFMAGLVYALDGHLARSSAHIYMLTPH